MSAPVTLTEALEAYAMDNWPGAASAAAMRRAYMAGALAALTSKAPRDALLAEIVRFGLSVGTAAERATP